MSQQGQDPNQPSGKLPTRRENRTPQKNSPLPSLFFWIFLLGIIPFMVIYMRGAEREKKVTQTDLEKAIVNKFIDSKLTLINSGSSNYCQISGKMKDSDGGEAYNFYGRIRISTEFEDFMRDNGVEFEYVPENNFWTNFIFTFGPIILILIILYFIFSKQLKSAGRGAMQFGKSKAKLVQSADKVTFDNVAGIDHAKEEVQEIVGYLRDPGKYHRLGGHIPHGILMVGPPGTGKTLLARAIAGEADVPFFSISGSDFVEMFVGVGASRVRDMFEQAKKNSPCIIFIDEIDAVGRSRFNSQGGGGHDEREQTLNALLVEMDGFEKNSGVIVIAATNRPDVLDKALLRPGRFDRQVNVDLPDLVGRREILEVHAGKIKLDKNVDFDSVARSTPGFSGADLENLLNEAALMAARANKDNVGTIDLEEARDKVMYGKERPFRAMSEHDRRMTACHEAGHALASIYCPHADPLHKVSIIPRGKMLGGAMYFPEGDKVSTNKVELEELIVIAAAGRCAENLIYKNINSGASGDIQQCTRIARAMVTNYGMIDEIGFIDYSKDDGSGMSFNSTPAYSEKTAQRIDEIVKEIIDNGVKRCYEILGDHRDQLMILTEELLLRETLSAEEVYLALDMPLPERIKYHKMREKGQSDSTEEPQEKLQVEEAEQASEDAEASADNTSKKKKSIFDKDEDEIKLDSLSKDSVAPGDNDVNQEESTEPSDSKDSTSKDA
ncbi:MAG: ATP-dependent zinc metalloprotease FtsH [Lentisphaeria bacterium]|nr:ATP-dependent zinc metalloprotease FtsH [Lentisphaeria bacterium]